MNNICKESILPSNSRVLLQLSGGKDSVACLLLLLQADVYVEAIHFTHKYSYSLPTEMATSICQRYGVNLHCVDITTELEKRFLDHFKGRPCRVCKSIMDRYTVRFAQENIFRYICVGDSADDTMLINRLKSIDGGVFNISRYFNKEVDLQPNIEVFRPLLFCHSDEILSFVKDAVPEFRRVNDTGDKYFEYSREGCPLQFKDFGAEYSPELMSSLKRYNELCSEYSTSLGIKAAIHLPSEFIVTIPKGFEGQCRSFLLEKGVMLSDDKNCVQTSTWHISARPNILLQDDQIKIDVLRRFCERLVFPTVTISSFGDILIANAGTSTISFIWNDKIGVLLIDIIGGSAISEQQISNLCIELFHTHHYSVKSIQI